MLFLHLHRRIVDFLLSLVFDRYITGCAGVVVSQPMDTVKVQSNRNCCGHNYFWKNDMIDL